MTGRPMERAATGTPPSGKTRPLTGPLSRRNTKKGAGVDVQHGNTRGVAEVCSEDGELCPRKDGPE